MSLSGRGTAWLLDQRQRGWVRCCLLVRRPARALAVLDRRLAHRPADVWALATRSVLHHQRGHTAAALADAQALVAAPGARPAAAWFNLGYMLEADGQWDAACAAFEQATALQPGLDTAWYGLGLGHLRAGRLTQALPALQRCTTLQPYSPHAWYQLARLHAELGEVQQALDIITRLQGFEPQVARRLAAETGLAAAGVGA
jgi:tetratricopeptide (TPR) repeat protein